jgi:predicted Fe-Mo cluster-binding NifX family protein
LDAEVDPRFGRAQYFVIVETEDMSCESIPNPNLDIVGGTGTQSAQLVIEKGCRVVITGHVGPGAQKTLESAGISIITGVEGISVRDAIEKFVKGVLREGRNGEISGDSLAELKKEFEEIRNRIGKLEEKLKKLEKGLG